VNRDYRYTIPGVFFAVPMIIGYYRLGTFDTGEKGMAAAVALVGTALLSFSVGYPISLMMGQLWSTWILPNPSSKLTSVILDTYGNRFPPDTSWFIRLALEVRGLRRLVPDGSKTLKMMVSALHNESFDQRILEFLSRRQTGFYMAVNSACGLVAGTVVFTYWNLLREWPNGRSRWVDFELPEVTLGAVFLLFAVGQAITNYQHHHALIAMIEPTLIKSIKGDNVCKGDFQSEPIPVPRYRAKWIWLGLTLIASGTAICSKVG
jgi:hypothetical protein